MTQYQNEEAFTQHKQMCTGSKKTFKDLKIYLDQYAQSIVRAQGTLTSYEGKLRECQDVLIKFVPISASEIKHLSQKVSEASTPSKSPEESKSSKAQKGIKEKQESSVKKYIDNFIYWFNKNKTNTKEFEGLKGNIIKPVLRKSGFIENEILNCDSVKDFEKVVNSYGLKVDYFKTKNDNIDRKE